MDKRREGAANLPTMVDERTDQARVQASCEDLRVRDLDGVLDQLLLCRFGFGFLALHVEEGQSVLELLEVHLRGRG